MPNPRRRSSTQTLRGAMQPHLLRVVFVGLCLLALAIALGPRSVAACEPPEPDHLSIELPLRDSDATTRLVGECLDDACRLTLEPHAEWDNAFDIIANPGDEATRMEIGRLSVRPEQAVGQIRYTEDARRAIPQGATSLFQATDLLTKVDLEVDAARLKALLGEYLLAESGVRAAMPIRITSPLAADDAAYVRRSAGERYAGRCYNRQLVRGERVDAIVSRDRGVCQLERDAVCPGYVYPYTVQRDPPRTPDTPLSLPDGPPSIHRTTNRRAGRAETLISIAVVLAMAFVLVGVGWVMLRRREASSG